MNIFMTCEKITIPFVLKGTTEREIIEQMQPNVNGDIINVSITPDMYEGKECCTVVIHYVKEKKELNNLPHEEWGKSRNFP
jgi:hypothetical protein